MTDTNHKEIKLYHIPFCLSAISLIGTLISCWFVTTGMSTLVISPRPEIDQLLTLWTQVGAALLTLTFVSVGAFILLYICKRDATIPLPKLGGEEE